MVASLEPHLGFDAAKWFGSNVSCVQASKLSKIIRKIFNRKLATYMAGQSLNPFSKTWGTQGGDGTMKKLTRNAAALATSRSWLAAVCMDQSPTSPGSAHLVRE